MVCTQLLMFFFVKGKCTIRSLTVIFEVKYNFKMCNDTRQNTIPECSQQSCNSQVCSQEIAGELCH